ncbi:MAG: aminotransferase class I/II-fold pyridoxal phosphate-dependent enzyme [Ruminococcus sp.]|nr:aminotransferase class I/II-fold pyridoxal phosphate-dependent enzyme [Ruminococcus sp.]
MTENLHGGDLYGKEILYDFSANINPLGMPESVKKALHDSLCGWEKYPDPYCRELVKKISEQYDFPEKNIVCGNGAADLIYRIIYALTPAAALVCAPGFSEYEKALGQTCGKTVRYLLDEKKDFTLDSGFLKYLDCGVDMLILCTPNNPTGKTVGREILEAVCGKCLEKNIIFLCDECFLDFADGGKSKSAVNFINKNVIVLKAFTKIYAMAGLRLGHALFGSAEIAEKVRGTGQFWSVSSPAQAAGIAALEEKDHIRRTVELISSERVFLSEELKKTGFTVFPSEANFILFKSGLPLDSLLSRKKILIRNCVNFTGLDKNFFRIAVKRHEENSVLINALRSIKNG